MNIYLLLNNGVPISAHWNKKMLLDYLESFQPMAIIKDLAFDRRIASGSPYTIGYVSMDSINCLVEDYYRHRKLVVPDTNQAFMFLTSEVGELADAVIKDQRDWVRNNPRDKTNDVSGEVGDCLMMLTVTSDTLNIDPLQAMQAKFDKKGYPSG